MPLLNTNVHVGNQEVRFTYPGSAGIAEPLRLQLCHVKGSEFWHLRVSLEEAERLHVYYGTLFRKDSEATTTRQIIFK